MSAKYPRVAQVERLQLANAELKRHYDRLQIQISELRSALWCAAHQAGGELAIAAPTVELAAKHRTAMKIVADEDGTHLRIVALTEAPAQIV